MTGIVYRHYRGGDEADIVRLWNECLQFDPITPDRFRKTVLLDANFDPEGLRLAYAGEDLVGAVFAVHRLLPLTGTDLEPDTGWIPWFFVSGAHRRQAIGTKLLAEALRFLASHGRQEAVFAAYAPNYILPGIDESSYPEGYRFLCDNGFEIAESGVTMDANLIGYQMPPGIAALKRAKEVEGYGFGALTSEDIVAVIRFAGTVFYPDWGRALREALHRGVPLGRIRVARTPDSRIAGFCMYGGYSDVQERFGPFGVDPAFQGTGLGKILFHDCLTAMRSEGLHGAWFLWTDEQSSAGHLYKSAGFQVSRRFHVMKKHFADGLENGKSL